MATENKLPKGPSNSAGMGATPGTQQTARNNVATGGFNPNMPIAPQVAKQGRSSYQQSISPPAPRPGTMPGPKPVPAARQTPKGPDTRVVSQGMPMQPGRGYNIFSGMDAGQISGMNQSMGLSNMTSLPPVNPAVNLSLSGGPGPAPGQDAGGQLLSESSTTEPDTTFDAGDGITYEYDPETGTVQEIANGIPVGDPKSLDNIPFDEGSDLEAWLESHGLEGSKSEQMLETAESYAEGTAGIPDEELEGLKTETSDKIKEYEETLAGYKSTAQSELDDQAAIQLQQALLGIDRQMAMAGMFGSGVHSAQINSAAATVLQGLLGEYNNLNKQEIDNLSKFMGQELGTITEYNILDLNMSDQDEQELFMNYMTLANGYAQQEQYTEDDLNEILNISEFFDETKTTEISEYAEKIGDTISGTAKDAFVGVLAQVQGAILEDTMPPNATMTKQEAAKNYIGAANLLIQAMNTYILEANSPGGNPDKVTIILDKLAQIYGITLPEKLSNLKF